MWRNLVIIWPCSNFNWNFFIRCEFSYNLILSIIHKNRNINILSIMHLWSIFTQFMSIQRFVVINEIIDLMESIIFDLSFEKLILSPFLRIQHIPVLIRYVWSKMYFRIVEALSFFLASRKSKHYHFNPYIFTSVITFQPRLAKRVAFTSWTSVIPKPSSHFSLHIFFQERSESWPLLDSILFFQKVSMLALSISFLM